MHLIATGGGTTVDDNPHDESIGVIPTNEELMIAKDTMQLYTSQNK